MMVVLRFAWLIYIVLIGSRDSCSAWKGLYYGLRLAVEVEPTELSVRKYVIWDGDYIGSVGPLQFSALHNKDIPLRRKEEAINQGNTINKENVSRGSTTPRPKLPTILISSLAPESLGSNETSGCEELPVIRTRRGSGIWESLEIREISIITRTKV